uniref:BPTI/Kunitz inhibitor domain-containing protein n=1 Tax=Panagrolaimus superbus TaxID=310955 RepID=A0A914ZE10_9BILA
MKLLTVLCLIISIKVSSEIVLKNEKLSKASEKSLEFIEKRKIEGVKNNEEQLLKKNIYTHDKNPICFLAAESGPCLALFRPYFFNKESGKCETFIYGGCKGNSNRFKTQKECEEECGSLN